MNDREFAAALRDRDAILILSHLRPDGDTLGSGAALCSALRRMGKTAYLFPNPETTARYLPYVAQFFAPADFVPACVVAVDIATPNLFPQGFSGAVDLCIDHHPSNALYAGDTLLHAEKSACGEAVLDVIELLTGSVTEQEADLLYIAVTTDTGCFQYANTNAATLRAAARLLELGADNRKISMDFFRKISRTRMALVGQIYSGMRFFRGGQVAIAVVTRALIDSVHATEDDCDDIAGLPGRAEGVVVSVTIRELLDGRSKISVRSNPEVDACAICAVYGGGGGVYLLHEVQLCRGGYPQPGGAGDGQTDLLPGQHGLDGAQGLAGPLTGLGVVPFIGAEQQLVLFVQHDHLYRCGTNINANS